MTQPLPEYRVHELDCASWNPGEYACDCDSYIWDWLTEAWVPDSEVTV